jgi:hypothetical protein
VHFDGGKSHLANGGDQGWLPGAIARRIDQSGGKTALMGLVEFINDFADNVRMENLDLEA